MKKCECGNDFINHLRIQAICAENKRLKKALEYYADKKMYCTEGYGDIVYDEGKRAREALNEKR